MNEKKVAAVTGGTGFIGSNLVKRLIKEKWEVNVIVRPDSKLNALKGYLGQINLFRYDGNVDTLIAHFKKNPPFVVFHLASLFIVEHKPDDIDELIQSNIIFGVKVVEAMVQNGIKNLINTGTSWQHYEDSTYNPVNLYAASKQALEVMLKYYIEEYDLNVINLLLFDTYGPGDERPKLINQLKSIANTKMALDMSPGEQLIDIVYIDDVVDAFIVAIDKIKRLDFNKYNQYAISSGKPVKLKKIVQIYSELINREIKINWGGKPYRKKEVMKPWSNFTVLRDWKPKVDLKDGLKKVI
jgi:nucleoside-diphosphate-sugar epimerase